MVRRLVLALVVVLAAASPAIALSCAVFPENTPEALVRNGLVLPSSEVVVFDLAVVGTVVRMTTDEDGQSPTYGRTEILVEVAGIFGETLAGIRVDELSKGLVVTTPDPGWMSGYPFVEGQAYFIPLLRVGPSGEPNYSFLCDPIAEVADPLVTAIEFGVIADHSGIDHLMVEDDRSTPPEIVENEEGAVLTKSGPVDPRVALASLLVAGSSFGLVSWLLRRQRGRRDSS